MTNIVKGEERTTLAIFTKNRVGTKFLYKADTIVFDEFGRRLDSESSSLQLGDVKPFSVMMNAEVNNIENMEGYGLPKIYNSIPLFKAVDLCYNILYGDLDKGQKLVCNELLACIQKDEDGKPYLTAQQKKLFILLGDSSGKLPEADTCAKSIIQRLEWIRLQKRLSWFCRYCLWSLGMAVRNILLKMVRLRRPQSISEQNRMPCRS